MFGMWLTSLGHLLASTGLPRFFVTPDDDHCVELMAGASAEALVYRSLGLREHL